MKNIKPIFLLLTAAISMTVVCSLTGFAEEESSTAETFTSGDYEYILNDDGSATLTKYLGSDAEIVVPDQVDDYDVTVLGGGIFANKDYITSIALPETLTELKDSCFYCCSSLETFTVADGNSQFQVKDDVLFSADGTYLYCYPLAKKGDSYTIPDGVVEIWSSAFAKASLTDIQFPDGLLYIDDWTFSYTQLSELHLPDSVTEIGGYAFAYCNNLTEIDFPADLEIIDAAAFCSNENLTAIHLPDGLQTIQMAAFAGTGMKDVTIPASVTYIGFCAFGYEADMETTVPNFTVYGEVGSQAEIYCTDTDEENSYENHFNFASVLSSDDESSDGESPVKIETKKTTSTGKWFLIGAGVLVLLIGGLVLILSGRKKDASDAGKKPRKSHKTDKEAKAKLHAEEAEIEEEPAELDATKSDVAEDPTDPADNES